MERISKGIRKVELPLSDAVVEALHAGDELLLTGVMYVARDAAHKRMIEALEAGEMLPVDLKGQVIYFMGPTPAKPGKPIGSAGPGTQRDDRQGDALRGSEGSDEKI
jgi:fumarate hydratase subunit beta